MAVKVTIMGDPNVYTLLQTEWDNAEQMLNAAVEAKKEYLWIESSTGGWINMYYVTRIWDE